MSRKDSVSVRKFPSAKRFLPLLFVGPALLVVIVLFVAPLIMTFWMSLHDWPLFGRIKFVGAKNYIRLFSDHQFWRSISFTLGYTIVITISTVAAAFPLAIFVSRPRRLVSLYRAAVFLPVVVGMASGSFLWIWLGNSEAGLFVPALRKLGLVDSSFNAFASFSTGVGMVIALTLWKTVGFGVIMLMTGLQAIPSEIREAAHIDGANAFQRFIYVKLPLVRRQLVLLITLTFASSMLAFDQFYILLSGGFGGQAVTAVNWIFSQSFVSFKLGYGSALSVVLLLFILVGNVLPLKFIPRGNEP